VTGVPCNDSTSASFRMPTRLKRVPSQQMPQLMQRLSLSLPPSPTSAIQRTIPELDTRSGWRPRWPSQRVGCSSVNMPASFTGERGMGVPFRVIVAGIGRTDGGLRHSTVLVNAAGSAT